MADEVSTIFHNHDLGKTSGTTTSQDFDFVGFRFGGVHSSDLGIKRVSDGSRYNEDLLPSLQDKTVQIPGGDGTYYFGSYYTQRTIPVSIAFDDMTEVQFRKLRTLISKKEPQQLIFDERPYKYYMAKVSPSAQSLKYICFEKDDGQRRYCGEGNLNFICYFPFARATHWKLDGFTGDEKKNIDQWKEGSGLPENEFLGVIDEKGCAEWRFGYWSTYESESGVASEATKINIYHYFFRLINPGDFESSFILTFPAKPGKVLDISLVTTPNQIIKTVQFKIPSFWSEEDVVKLDTGKSIMYLEKDKQKIIAPSKGDFFKIPVIKKDDKKKYWLKMGYNESINVLPIIAGSSKQRSGLLDDKVCYIDYPTIYF